MQHPSMEAFDRLLQDIVEAIDRELERRHGASIRLSRNRPSAESTSSPQMDGLFNVGLVFTPGFGSTLGRGYLLEVLIHGIKQPDPGLYEAWENEAAALLEFELAQRVPEKKFSLQRDPKQGNMYKLQGDFRLGAI